MNRELLELFFSEAAELTEAMVSGLLILEKNPGDEDQLHSVFRAAHTMKGNAATVGLHRLVTFAHAQENTLDLIRQGRLQLTGSVISTLLQSVDVLQELLDAAVADTPLGEDHLVNMEGRLAALGQTEPQAPGPASGEAGPARKPPQVQASPQELPLTEIVHDTAPPDDPAAPSSTSRYSHGRSATIAPAADRLAEPERVPESQGGAAHQGAAHDTIRLNVSLIDRLMAAAGELVLGRNQLCRLLEDRADEAPDLAEVLQRLSQVATDIQEHTMGMRMQQLAKVFNRLPRLVRDYSRQLGVEVALEISGAEVELDKSIVDALADPLMRLVANCIGHGLEKRPPLASPALPGSRRLTVQAGYQEGQVIITVTDHGLGLDPEQVADLALRNGLVDLPRLRLMNEAEKLSLIFRPNWSVGQTVGGHNAGGPWSGMDQVKDGIETVGGNLHVESRADQGTVFRLLLPLTLAIIPSLIVNAGGQCFAIPQRDVVEMIHLSQGPKAENVEEVGGAPVLRRRNRLLPLVALTDILQISSHPAGPALNDPPTQPSASLSNAVQRPSLEREDYVVVLRCGPDRFGLVVDGLTDTEEIVVKPLSTHIKTCRAYSGTTILGDGSVTIILNPGGLAEEAGLDFGEVSAEEQRRAQEQARGQKAGQGLGSSFLIFTNAPGEYFALPTADIVRLEKAPTSSAVRIGHREFYKHHQESLPILRLEDYLPVNPAESGTKEFYLVIPRTQGPSVGIYASGLLDIFEQPVHFEPGQIKGPGLKGTAVIEDRLTMFLDTESLLQQFRGRSRLTSRSSPR